MSGAKWARRGATCAAVLAVALAGRVTAHDLERTTVHLDLAADGAFTLRLAHDPAWLLLRMESFAGGTPLDATDAAARDARLAALAADAIDRVVLFVETVDPSGQVTSLEVRPTASEYAPPPAHVPDGQFALASYTLRGQMPPAARRVRWYYGMVADPYPFTIALADGSTLTEWVQGDAWSTSLPLGGPFTRPTLAARLGEYLELGYTHILPRGLDHILFVVGLFLLAARLRPVLVQVTTFTLAHSMTLGLALYGVVSLPATVVEPLIALSIVYVGIENLRTRQLTPWRVTLVFLFGLLHGLGFAGVLTGLQLPRADFALGLLGFNLGVEAGTAHRDRSGGPGHRLVAPSPVVSPAHRRAGLAGHRRGRPLLDDHPAAADVSAAQPLQAAASRSIIACVIPTRLVLGLALVAAAACGRSPQATPPPRNVVLLTIDTLRDDRLGRGVSPELDALAASGVRFTTARTTAPLTLPAHTSLLTGQLPPAHGVRLNGQTLAADVPTLATVLEAAGYRTAAFVGAYVLDRRFGLARGFDTYDDRVPRSASATDALEASRPAAAVVDAALSWLGNAPASPFLLWVHLYDPHAPYDPPEPYRTRFAGRPYDGEIAYAGAEAGRLLARLDQRGLTGSTIIVLAGDHGEGLGEHGESTHGMLAYDSTLRVPLVVRAPGLSPATVDVPVSLADVATSVLQLSGARAALPAASTRNLRNADPEGEVYAETTYPAVAGWHPLHVLAGPTRKLIRSAGLEYYDLAADRSETADVAGRESAQARAAVARLSPLMAATRESAPPAPDALATLRALGYASGPSSTASRSDAPNPSTTAADWTRFERAAAEPATELATLATLTTAHPDGFVFVTSYARALVDRGRPGEAARVLAAAITRLPSEASLFHDLAVAARAAGEIAEAVRAEDAALAIDPGNAAAHNGRGLLHVDAGETAEAAAAFTRAVTIDESNATYWANLGNARRAGADPTGADQAYARALALDPAHADAANGRGVLLVQAGQAGQAIDWFTRALATTPDFHEARLNLGIACQEAGRPAEAAAAYRELLRRAPRGFARERRAASELLRSLR